MKRKKEEKKKKRNRNKQLTGKNASALCKILSKVVRTLA